MARWTAAPATPCAAARDNVELTINFQDPAQNLRSFIKVLGNLDPERLAASQVNQGQSEVTADFRADPSGRTRFLVSTSHDNAVRSGRLVQRLIELETYSSLTFLAMPRAKEIGPKLAHIDHSLRQLTEDMSREECDAVVGFDRSRRAVAASKNENAAKP